MPSIQTKAFTRVKNFSQPNCSAVEWQPIDINFPDTAFAVNDLISLVELPPGVTLHDYSFHFPVIGAGFVFSFGLLNALGTDLATVYAAGVTAGQTNAVVRGANVDSAQDYTNTALARRLAIKVTTAAAPYVGATKTGQVLVALRSV